MPHWFSRQNSGFCRIALTVQTRADGIFLDLGIDNDEQSNHVHALTQSQWFLLYVQFTRKDDLSPPRPCLRAQWLHRQRKEALN